MVSVRARVTMRLGTGMPGEEREVTSWLELRAIQVQHRQGRECDRTSKEWSN